MATYQAAKAAYLSDSKSHLRDFVKAHGSDHDIALLQQGLVDTSLAILFTIDAYNRVSHLDEILRNEADAVATQAMLAEQESDEKEISIMQNAHDAVTPPTQLGQQD